MYIINGYNVMLLFLICTCAYYMYSIMCICVYMHFLCYGQVFAKSYTYTYIEQHKQYCPRTRTSKQKITTK